MPGMAKDHEVRELVQGLFGHNRCFRSQRGQTPNGRGILPYLAMAPHTPFGWREAGSRARNRRAVTVKAFDLESGVPFVAKRQRLARPGQGCQGKE